jgi:hypothetical protein
METASFSDPSAPTINLRGDLTEQNFIGNVTAVKNLNLAQCIHLFIFIFIINFIIFIIIFNIILMYLNHYNNVFACVYVFV